MNKGIMLNIFLKNYAELQKSLKQLEINEGKEKRKLIMRMYKNEYKS